MIPWEKIQPQHYWEREGLLFCVMLLSFPSSSQNKYICQLYRQFWLEKAHLRLFLPVSWHQTLCNVSSRQYTVVDILTARCSHASTKGYWRAAYECSGTHQESDTGIPMSKELNDDLTSGSTSCHSFPNSDVYWEETLRYQHYCLLILSLPNCGI